MLDIKLFRETPEVVRESQKRRGEDPKLVDDVIAWDNRWRKALQDIEKLKHEKNTVSEEINQIKKQGKSADEKIKQMREVADKIKELEEEVERAKKDRDELLLLTPNILDKTVPVGGGEADNKIIKKGNKIPSFKFTPKSHVELGEVLDLADTEKAAKVAGARFYYLKNELVKLNWAIVIFALDFLQKKGFKLVQPPFMLNRKTMGGAVPLSAFEEMIYKIEGEDLYLIGTAEHALNAYYFDETLDAKNLPIRFAGISTSFRKEAGAHGKDMKGIFRTHQFEKIEQFVFCKPEDSWKEFDLIAKNAQELFKLLGLPFRVVVLCSKETGRVATKTYDLEGWFPAQKTYRELGSCSNCLDYQARRSNIRYRAGEGAEFVHTLNNTAIATERTMCCLLENFQQKDGSIKIPKVLWKYTEFKEIKPKKR